MDRVAVYLLHGFLGRPEDWNFLTSFAAKPAIDFHALDYFHSPQLNPEHSFDEFARNFNQEVRARQVEHHILIGYSLGGRLALHTYLAEPRLWTKVILLSTNPGLQNDVEKAQRQAGDAEWAARFRQENWDSLLRAWNSQGVLRDSKEPARVERNYRREDLARSLENWSLARQQDLRPQIQKHIQNIDWIVGAQDTKFVAIANEVKKQNPGLDVDVVPQASHRVFFDQPEFCARLLSDKIKKAVNL